MSHGPDNLWDSIGTWAPRAGLPTAPRLKIDFIARLSLIAPGEDDVPLAPVSVLSPEFEILSVFRGKQLRHGVR